MVLWWIEWNKGIWRNISEIRRRSPIFFFRPIKLSSLKFVLSLYLIPLPPSIYICITYLAAPIFFPPQHSFNEYKLLHFKNLLKLSRISRPQNCDCVKKYYCVRHSFTKLTWVYNPPNSGESSCAQCGKILRKKLAEISRKSCSILGLCWCCECERAGGAGEAAVKRSLAGSPISSIWNHQPTWGNFYRQLQRKRGGMQAAGGVCSVDEDR